MTTHLVTAPLVVVKDERGAVHYHYEGALLPSYVAKADLARMVTDGLVTPVEPLIVEPTTVVPVRRARRQTEPSTVPTVPTVPAGPVEDAPVTPTSALPAKL